MQILKDIKLGRLLLAVGVTLLIADTAPHPQLSTGLLATSFNRLQVELGHNEVPETAIAESDR